MVGCYSTGQVARGGSYYSQDYGNGEISYETFYDQLQPYGNWVNYPEYGNVWQPYMQNGFRPYESGGHWVSTVDGWAWASDYNWGWAPFHYGRWFFDQSIGWAWVPGYEWAPAWVTWGQYNDYYAWAPLAPGINVGIGNNWRAPANYWSFVPRNYINYSNLNRYAIAGNYNTNVNNINIINNYNSYNQKDYYHRGPDYQEVQRFTHKPITPVTIAPVNKPGSARVVNRQLQIYRPPVSANVNNNNAVRNINTPNNARTYQGAVKNGQPGNGINGTNVTRENINNTNRQLQQQQMDSRLRSQTTGRTIPSESPAPAAPPTHSVSPAQQNIYRRPEMRNTPPADVQQSQPQPRFPNERIMQRPGSPTQNERVLRQPQTPVMPDRMQNREGSIRSSMPSARPGGSMQRPSRF